MIKMQFITDGINNFFLGKCFFFYRMDNVDVFHHLFCHDITIVQYHQSPNNADYLSITNMHTSTTKTLLLKTRKDQIEKKSVEKNVA